MIDQAVTGDPQMYPQDFPVERAVPVISLPMVLAGLAVLSLAVWAGYALARMKNNDRPSPRAVAASIHAAIQRKLNAALAAHGGATINAAQALVDEIEIRLGSVQGLAGPLGKSSGALKDAIAGKVKPATTPAPLVQPVSPHAVIVPIPGQGGGAAASAASGLGGAGAAAVGESGGLVGAVLHLPPGPPPPPPPPSPPQHVAGVRAALEEFAGWWGTTPSDPAADARVRELEAAARLLATEVPAPKPKPGGHH
jgi:hypothetical protein